MSAPLRTTLCMAGFLLGIVLASQRPLHPSAAWWTAAFALCLLCVARPRPVPLLVLSLLVGLLYTSLWRARRATTFAFAEAQAFSAVIVDRPDIRHDKILLTVQPDRPLQGQRGPGLIQVTAPRYPVWQYGDSLQVQGAVRQPEALQGFNYPLFLERYGIYGTIARPGRLRLLAHDRGSPLLAALYRLGSWLERQIQNAIPEPESSFLGGILLGSKRAIPDDITAALRQTGTSHIIAISGANITILLDILVQLAPITKRVQQFWLVVLISAFITVLTGASASVLRGAVTACLSAYLKLISRRAWATPFILCSMTLLVLGNPLLLVADPGFQLSFAAFAGLAYFTPFLERTVQRTPIGRWPDVLKGSLVETTSATLGTAAISLWTFRQLSLLGLVVNPLILWLLPPITLLGLVLLCGSWIPFLSSLITLPLWLLLHAVLAVIRSFSRINFGVITLSP